MNTNMYRSYNCKDEELPVICGFIAMSFARDFTYFEGYSPMFNQAYMTGFKERIQEVFELVRPKSETIELKLITERMNQKLDELIQSVNFVEGYLKLAGKTVPISAADFGLSELRRSIRSRDVESVLNLIRIVDGNLNKYKSELMAKGATEGLLDDFLEAFTALSNDKNRKFGLISNRAYLVQSNREKLNQLYEQFVEISTIGKMFFRQTDKAKLKDYTFSHLLKQVRRTEKNGNVDEPETPETAG